MNDHLMHIVTACLFLSLLTISNALSATSSSSSNTIPTPSRISTTKARLRQQYLPQNEAREYCPGCNRPPTQCLCEHLPSSKINLNTQVLVLQHPTEFRRQTISTVPILKLVLESCQVLVGRSFDAQLESIIDDACSEGRIPLLLFPGPDAITLEDSDAMEQLDRAHCTKLGQTYDDSASTSTDPSNPSKHLLILVDGTWTQAKKMLRNSPILLEKCQPIQFTGTSDRSIYDSIRKQPDTFCLSTLESCARTLMLLEPNNPNMEEATGHLLNSLRALVLTQMDYERKHLEENPELVRNVKKLQEKKKRQEQIIIPDNIDISVVPKNSMKSDGGNENPIPLQDSEIENDNFPDGYKLRPLKGLADAEYVNSRWPYKSNKSLRMIERQINADNINATKTGFSTCLGIEYCNKNDEQNGDAVHLVACILRHRNGSLGILHVDEDHRMGGLGARLVKEATRALLSRGEGKSVYAFIVDGNRASEALFTKLGWVKADPNAKSGTGKRKAKRMWIYNPEIAD